MTIEVTIKNVYGNYLVYPVCEMAKRFASLVGRKTLTDGDLQKIRDMGFEIVYVAQIWPVIGGDK